jgi:hypothetical protein
VLLKNGKYPSQQELNIDMYECRKDNSYVSKGTSNTQLHTYLNSMETTYNEKVKVDSYGYDLCLNAKGYSRMFIYDKEPNSLIDNHSLTEKEKAKNLEDVNKSRSQNSNCKEKYEFSDGYVVCMDRE